MVYHRKIPGVRDHKTTAQEKIQGIISPTRRWKNTTCDESSAKYISNIFRSTKKESN
jgi:hypothetical protein